jgi:hypothetical protein
MILTCSYYSSKYLNFYETLRNCLLEIYGIELPVEGEFSEFKSAHEIIFLGCSSDLTTGGSDEAYDGDPWLPKVCKSRLFIFRESGSPYYVKFRTQSKDYFEDSKIVYFLEVSKDDPNCEKWLSELKKSYLEGDVFDGNLELPCCSNACHPSLTPWFEYQNPV